MRAERLNTSADCGEGLGKPVNPSVSVERRVTVYIIGPIYGKAKRLRGKCPSFAGKGAKLWGLRRESSLLRLKIIYGESMLSRRSFLKTTSALAAGVAVGCKDTGDGPEIVYTPGGYRVAFLNNGSIALVNPYTLFDECAERAVRNLSNEGFNPIEVREAIKSYQINIVDHFLFGTTASYTGYATGMIGYGLISLALYSRAYNANGPYWTWFDWGGTTEIQSGLVPLTSEVACPALEHEIKHHFLGAFHRAPWKAVEVIDKHLIYREIGLYGKPNAEDKALANSITRPIHTRLSRVV